MLETLQRLLGEYRKLSTETERLTEALRKADQPKLLTAFEKEDDNDIADTLGMSVDELLAIFEKFHDAAELFPELKQAATVFTRRG